MLPFHQPIGFVTKHGLRPASHRGAVGSGREAEVHQRRRGQGGLGGQASHAAGRGDRVFGGAAGIPRLKIDGKWWIIPFLKVMLVQKWWIITQKTLNSHGETNWLEPHCPIVFPSFSRSFPMTVHRRRSALGGHHLSGQHEQQPPAVASGADPTASLQPHDWGGDPVGWEEPRVYW